jgi:16S rRNA processing protein RimM
LASSRKPPEERIALGRVAGAYGVRGWVKVEPASEALVAAKSWRIGDTDYVVEETKLHSNAVLAKLAGLTSREAALRVKGKVVSLQRAVLPKPEEGRFYWADLIGLEVVNAQGLVLGVVKAMFSHGAHDVMELAGDRTRLLPWVPVVVRRVDLEGRRVEVDWGADW